MPLPAFYVYRLYDITVMNKRKYGKHNYKFLSNLLLTHLCREKLNVKTNKDYVCVIKRFEMH